MGLDNNHPMVRQHHPSLRDQEGGAKKRWLGSNRLENAKQHGLNSDPSGQEKY